MGQVTKTMIEAGLAAQHRYRDEANEREVRMILEVALGGPSIAWESTTSLFIKYITDERYQKFSGEVKRWYKPYRCSLCNAPAEQMMGTWRPITEADKGIAYIHDLGELRIGNSYPIWARDADGRVFECLWADDGKKAYWWDIEGESPVDPIEFMPHPLAASATEGSADA